MTLLIVMLGVMLLLFLRVHIVFCLAVPALIYFLAEGIPLEIFAQRAVSGVDQYTLVAIPLFVLVGTLFQEGGQVDEMVASLRTLLGRKKTAIAHLNILATTLFSGLNGSAAADVATLGPVLIPLMSKAGYRKTYAVALTASASIVGPIIPPSIVFIFYGTLMHVPVTDLFLGGVVPGLTYVAVLAMIVYFQDRKLADLIPVDAPQISVGAFARGLLWPAILAAGILLSISLGFATPTEAGAIAALLSVLIGFLTKPAGILLRLGRATASAGRTTAEVLLLIAASTPLAWIFAYESTASTMQTALQLQDMTSIQAIFLVNATFLVLGFFLDTFPAMIIGMPLIAPLIVHSSLHPVQLGVLVAMNLMIGAIHPPVGVCLYLASKIGETSVWAAFRECLPFILAAVIVLSLVSFVPAFTLSLLPLSQ